MDPSNGSCVQLRGCFGDLSLGFTSEGSSLKKPAVDWPLGGRDGAGALATVRGPRGDSPTSATADIDGGGGVLEWLTPGIGVCWVGAGALGWGGGMDEWVAHYKSCTPVFSRNEDRGAGGCVGVCCGPPVQPEGPGWSVVPSPSPLELLPP